MHHNARANCSTTALCIAAQELVVKYSRVQGSRVAWVAVHMQPVAMQKGWWQFKYNSMQHNGASATG